jgi:hypothetical protein
MKSPGGYQGNGLLVDPCVLPKQFGLPPSIDSAVVA